MMNKYLPVKQARRGPLCAFVPERRKTLAAAIQACFGADSRRWLATLCLSLGMPAAQAVNGNWNGSVSSDWATAGNWAWSGAVPTAGDDALVSVATGNTPIIGSATAAHANTVVVGGGSNGILTILGTLNSASGLLGNNLGTPTTSGSVTVSGSGANWSNSGDLHIGNYGVGVLNVQGGASLSAGNFYLGSTSGTNGSLILSGSGSTATSGGYAFIGNSGTGTLNVGSGTTLTSASGGVLGLYGGSSGTATINGTWNMGSGNLVVGSGGQGNLTISAGGDVSNAVGSIGSASNGLTSSVTVIGAGSSWTNSDRLFVGVYGKGQLDILSGATVSSGDTALARYAGSTGTVNVSGAGSSWGIGGSLRVGGDITDAANPGGTGTLNISNGGLVTSSAGSIGDSQNAIGSVTIDNAAWNISGRLGVGNFGKGTLTVQNGGTLTSTGGLVGWQSSSTNNSVLVTGTGSTWTMSGHLYVGNEGQGTMTISAGGKVTNVDGFIGTVGNGVSEVTVTGSGSQWENQGDLLVGQSSGGKGKLTIGNGATVTSVQAILGDLAGTTGTAVITGSGSSLTASGDFNVGRFGTGSLTLGSGGTLSSDRGYVANEAGSTGTVLISGSGSGWPPPGTLHLRSRGDGSLVLSDGGDITAGSLVIAHSAGSTGTLSIGAEEGSAAAAAGTIHSGSITLGAGDGTLVLNHTDSNYQLASVIAGTGDIKVLGGTTVLTAVNTFTGSTSIASGAGLSLADSAALGGNVTVAHGGTLTVGQSNVGGNISNSGTLSVPEQSGSYKTLSVGGNYTQAGNGTLRLGVNGTGAGQYSQLSVTGSASLNGTLAVDVASGSPLTLGDRLNSVITATGGVSGQFSSITDNSTLFNLRAVYGSNDVDLLLVAASNNAVSSALQSTGNSQGGGAGAVLDALIAQNPTSQLSLMFAPLTSASEVSRAVSQSLPLLTGNNVLASQSVIANVGQLINNRVAAVTGMASGDSQFADRQFWIKPFGSRATQADSNGSAGYHASTAGMVFGLDGQVSDADRLGVALAYADASVDNRSAVAPHNASVKLYQLIGYGSRNLAPGTELSWQVDGGYNSNRGNRDIRFAGVSAHSKFDTYTAHAGLRLTRNLTLSERTVVAPSVGLDYTWMRNASYQESGAGALNLQVKRQDVEQILLSADARFSHRLDNGINLLANLGAAYDLRNQQAAVTAAYAGAPGSYFITNGVESDPWIVRAGLGLSKLTAGGLEIIGRVDGEHRQGFNNRSASVNLRWAF